MSPCLRASAVIALLATPAFGQGLSSLTDDALLADLARRNQTVLLERAFEQNHTPADQRDAIRATAALARLKSDARRMPAAERQATVAKVVAGLNTLLPKMNDPRRLAEQADALLAAGVSSDVNTLEYWGPNVGTQAQLKPVVETVVRMLDRTDQLAGDAAGKLAEGARADDAATMKRIDEFETLSQVAQQTKALAGYYLALCYDAADPKRAEAAAASIDYLEGFDVDGNPARPNLKLVLGKLYATKGDFEKARAAFDFVIADGSTTTGGPSLAGAAGGQAANSAARVQQFEARFFRAVVDIQQKKSVDARKAYDALLVWENEHPSDDASIATANALLEYRIVSIEPGDQAKGRATALLIDLLQRRPDLEGPIMTQLRAGIAPGAAMGSLEPLLLRSLVTDAQEQVVRGQRDPLFKPEQAVVTRGLDAAQELVGRKGRPGVDDRLVGDAQFLVGVFLETLDRKSEAAARYLDYAEANRDKPEPATAALTNAQRLFAQLGGLRSDDAKVTKLYDRILPLALGAPFKQKALAYDWAYRLQQMDRPDEASVWYRQVDRADRRYAASRYYLMVALSQSLDKLPAGDARRKPIAAEIVTLADEVTSAASAALASAADEPAKALQRQRLARTALLAANIARTEQGDPRRSLELLNAADPVIAALSNADDLVGEVMFTRIQSNMQLGHTDAAVRELVQLLDRTGGAKGAQIVYTVLSKLERDFGQAEANADRKSMAELQANRAALTPYLVKWAENNYSSEIKNFAYTYRVYDAETQRVAAELLQDITARSSKRSQALELFDALSSESGRAAYRRAHPSSRLAYDPEVSLGIARIAYDAQDWPAAREGYAKLLVDRALGTAIATVRDASGQEKEVDNDAYWEATLRLIDVKVKAGDDVEPLKTLLREQVIRWGDRVGGTKWKELFQTLRQSLIPDFQP